MHDGRRSANDLRPQIGEKIMGKIVSAIMAVTLAAGPLLVPVSARAENGQIAAGAAEQRSADCGAVENAGKASTK